MNSLNWPSPGTALVTVLVVIIEPSSNDWLRYIQWFKAKYWAEIREYYWEKGRGIIEVSGVKELRELSMEMANLSHRISGSLNQQQESLHGTDLCLLNIWDSWVACVMHSNESRVCHWCFDNLLVTILNTGENAWS